MTDDVKALIAEARRVIEVEDSGWLRVDGLLASAQRALEAATVAPSADRVKASMVLWEVLWPGTVDVMDHPELGAERFKVRQILDALTSSNVLRDVRDVQAETLEQAAKVADAYKSHPKALDTAEHIGSILRERAQAVREARND